MALTTIFGGDGIDTVTYAIPPYSAMTQGISDGVDGTS